ncbi:hypothetical protein [Pseudooceanicola onchidii]|uniref:hypothetical protein n=1 Tax=Pseudooceanicola onchidii TaxID=2562279 RepID=UPI0010AB05F7|nr:hypothetical protein [Pseudooceanicola onchidii]
MSTYLSKEIRDGLAAARARALRKSRRLRVVVDGVAHPVLRLERNGFALPLEDAPRLRGLVDLYDGARHVCQCLIVASAEEGGEMIYEFKRRSVAMDGPALDFARNDDAPAALLPRF